MKFTKFNNPNRKKPYKRLNYTDACIFAMKEQMIDERLGYIIPNSYYENKVKKVVDKEL